MIKDKRILLLCKETYSFPLYFAAKKLLKNNTVGAFFFMPPESEYRRCLHNTNTYYKFLELEGIEIFTSSRIATEFTATLDSPKPDLALLRKIEESEDFRNINLQLMASQFTSGYYHFRGFYSDFTYEQALYWYQLNYQNVCRVLDEFKPDMILDLDDAELPRTILNQVARQKAIPYITIDHPRYELFKTPTYQMGIGVDPPFQKLYEQAMNGPEADLATECRYIEDYRDRSKIIPKEYVNTTTGDYRPTPPIVLAKRLLGKVLYFFLEDFASGNRRLKHSNPLLYPNSARFIKFFFDAELRRNRYLRKNRLFEAPIEGEEYVYMPLHLIPESTTFVKAPLYINELFLIEEISKSLPAGWRLYVKEHPAMLGERHLEFYQKLKGLSNVRLVQVGYYPDPKPWIEKARGVITVTGSSAYEAALLGKPSIVFGDVPFGLISSVTVVTNLTDLPRLIRRFALSGSPNLKSCAAYIAAVKRFGSEIKLKYLMLEGERILEANEDPSSEYDAEIDALLAFFAKAYEQRPQEA